MQGTGIAHLSSDTEHKLGMEMGRMLKWNGILDIACLKYHPLRRERSTNHFFLHRVGLQCNELEEK